MTVAVTGASGHLGANLVRALLEEGRRVRALVHEDARALDGLDLERVRGDVLDLPSLERAFAGAQTVFHLAARVSVDGPQRGRVAAVNAGGTRNVVAACLSTGVGRLVHFSSIHAFSQEPRDEPLDESRAPASGRGAFAYDLSKADGEREVLAGVARGLDAVILEPTSVLGPWDVRPSPLGRYLLDVCRGRVPAVVEGGFDWVDARDVCASALSAERRGRPGERYLLPGAYLPLARLVALVTDAAGVKAPRWVVPQAAARAAAPLFVGFARLSGTEPLFTGESVAALRTGHPDVRGEKAARELGHSPRPIAGTVADTVGWFREAGRLGEAR